VRELQNIIQRAMVLVEENVIRPMDLELPGQAKRMEAKSFRALEAQVVEDFERSYLEQLLVEHDGNITHAARCGSCCASITFTCRTRFRTRNHVWTNPACIRTILASRDNRLFRNTNRRRVAGSQGQIYPLRHRDP
jgi:hypothetical protein